MTLLQAGLLLALLAPAAPAGAESFRVLLGGAEVGTLAIEGGDGELSLDASFAGTPLGVADGTFGATSRPAQGAGGEVVRQYLAQSDFSGGRTVSVLLSEGPGGSRAVETTIDPVSDRSDLSDPAAVPPGVVDPVAALAAIVRAGGCPAPIRLYDGRRVAEFAVVPGPVDETGNGATACAGTYRVVAGPGHVSPLSISSFDVALLYDAGGALASLEVRTGPFVLTLAP